MKCQICDDELLTGDTKHDCLGKRTMACEYCGLSFDYLPDLIGHFNSAHADAEKLIYVCDICRVKVHTRVLLEVHKERHTRDSFACPKCPQVFNKKLELAAHTRLTHVEASKWKLAKKPKSSLCFQTYEISFFSTSFSIFF